MVSPLTSVSSRYPVLKVPAAGRPASPSLGHPRGKEIYCQSPGAPGATISVSTFRTYLREKSELLYELTMSKVYARIQQLVSHLNGRRLCIHANERLGLRGSEQDP